MDWLGSEGFAKPKDFSGISLVFNGLEWLLGGLTRFLNGTTTSWVA